MLSGQLLSGKLVLCRSLSKISLGPRSALPCDRRCFPKASAKVQPFAETASVQTIFFHENLDFSPFSGNKGISVRSLVISGSNFRRPSPSLTLCRKTRFFLFSRDFSRSDGDFPAFPQRENVVSTLSFPHHPTPSHLHSPHSAPTHHTPFPLTPYILYIAHNFSSRFTVVIRG